MQKLIVSPFSPLVWVMHFGGGNLGSSCVTEMYHGSNCPSEMIIIPNQSLSWFQLLTGLCLMPFEIPQL